MPYKLPGEVWCHTPVPCPRSSMHAMLASGGHPWTIVLVKDRGAYLAALEAASVGMSIEPFARFIAERVQWS